MCVLCVLWILPHYFNIIKSGTFPKKKSVNWKESNNLQIIWHCCSLYLSLAYDFGILLDNFHDLIMKSFLNRRIMAKCSHQTLWIVEVELFLAQVMICCGTFVLVGWTCYVVNSHIPRLKRAFCYNCIILTLVDVPSLHQHSTLVLFTPWSMEGMQRDGLVAS